MQRCIVTSYKVLTYPDAIRDGEWAEFCQNVYNQWAEYGWKKTTSDGHKEVVLVRPHWAKEWDKLQMQGMDARKYLKTMAYRERIPEFKIRLVEIGKMQGWSVEDLQRRFSNKL
jgi:hypothetical protein